MKRYLCLVSLLFTFSCAKTNVETYLYCPTDSSWVAKYYKLIKQRINWDESKYINVFALDWVGNIDGQKMYDWQEVMKDSIYESEKVLSWRSAGLKPHYRYLYRSDLTFSYQYDFDDKLSENIQCEIVDKSEPEKIIKSSKEIKKAWLDSRKL